VARVFKCVKSRGALVLGVDHLQFELGFRVVFSATSAISRRQARWSSSNGYREPDYPFKLIPKFFDGD